MLFHQHRQLTDGELWFFVNSGLETQASATVKAGGKWVERLDPLTGRTSPYSASRQLVGGGQGGARPDRRVTLSADGEAHD